MTSSPRSHIPLPTQSALATAPAYRSSVVARLMNTRKQYLLGSTLASPSDPRMTLSSTSAGPLKCPFVSISSLVTQALKLTGENRSDIFLQGHRTRGVILTLPAFRRWSVAQRSHRLCAPPGSSGPSCPDRDRIPSEGERPVIQ